MDKNFETLIGKDIQDARTNYLGWWWVLENQSVNYNGGHYHFYRVGHNPNHVELWTDEKNIITKVKSYLSF